MENRVNAYFKDPSVNFSLLKTLWNPRQTKWKLDHPDDDEKSSSPLRIGGALDALLTTDEEFENVYCHFKGQRPSEAMCLFIENLLPNLNETSDQSLYQDAYEISGYKSSLPAVIKRFWSDARAVEYYKFLQQSLGKTVIDSDEMDVILKMKKSLVGNPFHKWIWTQEDDTKEIHYQVPIYFEDRGLNCKALLDILVIDHANKTMEPIDLKTTGRSVVSFDRAIIKQSYFLQAAHYQRAVKTLHEQPDKVRKATLSLPADYTLKNISFLVVSTLTNEPVERFHMSNEDLHKARYGGYRNSQHIRGTAELLDDLKWHMKHDIWDCTRAYYNSKGNSILNLYQDEI